MSLDDATAAPAAGAGRFTELAERVRNWGRWIEDGRGTLNHIDPAAVIRGAAQVREGKVFPLGLNFDRNGPQVGPRRDNPRLYVTATAAPINPARPGYAFADDVIHMPAQAATQWDALAHVHYDGALFNGHPVATSLSPDGAARGGAEHLARAGVVTRGVLLDVARANGVDRLPPGHLITPAELDAVCAAEKVTVDPGDIVLIRTGHMRLFLVDEDRVAYTTLQPGVAADVAPWLFDRSAAAIAADNVGVEQVTTEMYASDVPLPFHMLAIRDMGMPLGEMWNLEDLAADCAADGRYTLQLCAPPLALTGAFGSPVNPVAVK